MKKFLILLSASILLFACNNKAPETGTDTSTTTTTTPNTSTPKPPDYDPNRGIGKFSSVEVGAKLDKKMAIAGKSVYDVKCSGCHKLTSEKLVGPGWEGVTKRYSLHWIMNFVTNTDEMIDTDPKAQAQLEICLVRMPNQHLTDEDARSLVEFMRQNDGVK